MECEIICQNLTFSGLTEGWRAIVISATQIRPSHSIIWNTIFLSNIPIFFPKEVRTPIYMTKVRTNCIELFPTNLNVHADSDSWVEIKDYPFTIYRQWSVRLQNCCGWLSHQILKVWRLTCQWRNLVQIIPAPNDIGLRKIMLDTDAPDNWYTASSAQGQKTCSSATCTHAISFWTGIRLWRQT